MKPLYIFDLDGTLADQTHRRPYLDGPKPDWMAYFDACPDDTPIQPVINTMHSLIRSGADVWIFSGRSECVRRQTLEWLLKHTIVFSVHDSTNFLTMRRVGDTRPDDVVKKEMLDNMLIEDRERLVAIFDDRDRVVAMWRANGVPCFQVAPGNF